METLNRFVEWIAVCIEMLAVAVIVGAIIVAALPRAKASKVARLREDGFSSYKQRMGRGLLLGLELMLAADILSTVALTPTLEGLAALGLLAVIRTFLSWSLDVEIDGCWPWQARGETERIESKELRSEVGEISRG